MTKQILPSLLLISLMALSNSASATEMTEASLKQLPPTNHIEWQHTLGPAQEIAEVNDRPILLFFTASWCGPCQSVKQTTMKNPSVIRELSNNFVPVMLDFDQNRYLASQLNVSVVPTIMVLDPSARDLLHKVSNTSSGMFVRELQKAKQAKDHPIKSISLSK